MNAKIWLVLSVSTLSLWPSSSWGMALGGEVRPNLLYIERFGADAETQGNGDAEKILRFQRKWSLKTGFDVRPDFSQPSTLILAQETGEETASQVAFQTGMEHYLGGTATRWQEAIAQWEEALELARQEGDRDQEALTLLWLGLAHSNLKALQPAADYYNRVLKIYQEIGDRHSQASTLMSLGQIKATWGEYQAALDDYDRALQLWQEVEYRTGEAATLNNIGFVYADLGDRDRALEYYQQALALVKELGNPSNAAAMLNNIGRIYSDWGKTEQALSAYNQALTLWQEANNTNGEASTLNNLGFVYADNQDWTKAREYYDRALPLWRKLGDKSGEASTLTNLGFTYANSGDRARALEYYNQALPLRRQVGDRAKEALTLFRIASVRRDLGDLDEAQRQIEAALEIIEDLRTNVANSELRASFFASKQEYYEFYIDLLMQRHNQNPGAGYDRLALQNSERTRARTLLEVLQEAKADIRQGVDPQLLSQERQLQGQLSAMEEARVKLLSGKHSNEREEALDREIETLLQQYRQVQTEIRATSPRYAALTQPKPLSATEIQQQVLNDETMLLEYFLGEERSYLWVVTASSFSSYELPGRAQIESAAKDYLKRLVSPSQRRRVDKVAAAEATLSEMILGPASDRLQGKRLLVVSDGVLQYIPFAALSQPGTTNSGNGAVPLIQDYEVITLPSASTLAVLRREQAGRAIAPKALAVFADPVFAPDDDRVVKTAAFARELPLELQQSALSSGTVLSRLPYTREEAEKILAPVPESETAQAFGFSASRTFATSDELSQYRTIHFATHGLANSQNPELSGLVLSLFDEEGQPQNGFLRMHELFNLELPAELVVLSACQTGLGEYIRGEGIVGLTRGFMYAGAARVVVSLWNVDDRGTAELMSRFYRHMLQDKLSPAAALRAAQLEMSQTEEWKSPYYWAGFTLQGEWN